MKTPTGDIILLSIPQTISLRQGSLLLQEGDCISIDPGGTGPDSRDSMLPVAQKVKQELADLAGVHLAIVIGDRAASRRAIIFQHEGKLPDQVYILSTSEEGILIRYGRPSGAFHATRTLKQLVRQCGRSLPAMEIIDEPDSPSRGFMLDIGRDKIPTMDTLRRVVDLMADVKLNHLELYIEGVPFAYASYPFMWEPETLITGEEIMNLGRYCRGRVIELVPNRAGPNQNSFGHMAPWPARRSLNHLAECPDGFDFHGRRMPPTTLNPRDPDSINLVQTL